MAKQVINVGSSANDGTGDKVRVAFQKTNANFTELYDGKIDSIVAGTNVTVDNTDPLNPIVSATGGGGGGIPDAPNDANAYVRSALAWVIGYTKTAIDTLLGNKVDKITPITGATKTKVTYNTQGQVTAGADATTDDIPDSVNKRYQTDAQRTTNDATSSIQGQIDLKQPYAVARTTTAITFDVPAIYNSFTTPQTGVLTSDLTGARIGVVQVIYLNRASFTPPSGWVNIGSRAFQASVVNIIYAKWSESSRVEYWISKATA